MRVLALLPLLLATPALAQVQDAQIWTVAATSLPLEKNLTLDLELSARFSEGEQERLYETLQQLYVTKKLPGGMTVSLGYQRNQSANRSPGTIENRLRQRIAGPLGKIGRGDLRYQLQTEQRFRNDGQDVHYRARPRLFYQYPLTPGGDTLLIASHESFFATRADWTSQVGWFRMRNQLSVRTPVVDDVTIEAAYLSQFEPGKEGARDTLDHIAIVTLSFIPD